MAIDEWRLASVLEKRLRRRHQGTKAAALTVVCLPCQCNVDYVRQPGGKRQKRQGANPGRHHFQFAAMPDKQRCSHHAIGTFRHKLPSTWSSLLRLKPMPPVLMLEMGSALGEPGDLSQACDDPGRYPAHQARSRHADAAPLLPAAGTGRDGSPRCNHPEPPHEETRRASPHAQPSQCAGRHASLEDDSPQHVGRRRSTFASQNITPSIADAPCLSSRIGRPGSQPAARAGTPPRRFRT